MTIIEINNLGFIQQYFNSDLRFAELNLTESNWTELNQNYRRVSEWQYSNTPSCEPTPFGEL